eukprot:403373515
MQKTKDEMRLTYSELSKLMVKKEQFMTFHHLTSNLIALKANEPMYCKFPVNLKKTPLNVLIFKQKVQDIYQAYFSRTEQMPSQDCCDGEFSNTKSYSIQDRYEVNFTNSFMFFTPLFGGGGGLGTTSYNNMGSPDQQHNDSDLEDYKKQKFKYYRKIKDILNDSHECKRLQLEAKKIKNERRKRNFVMKDSRNQKLSVILKQFISEKPPEQSIHDFKLEMVFNRKSQIEEDQFKKNLFLLNKQEILKDYKLKASKDAVKLKKDRKMCKQFLTLILQKQMLCGLFQEFQRQKEARLAYYTQKAYANRIIRFYRRYIKKKIGRDLQIRLQRQISLSLTTQGALWHSGVEDRTRDIVKKFLEAKRNLDNTLYSFHKFQKQVYVIQKQVRVVIKRDAEKMGLVGQRWEACLNELKNEYMMDTNQKDKLGTDMFRGLKLLGEESKKREITKFYKSAKSYYDQIYFNWRDLVKSYNQLGSLFNQSTQSNQQIDNIPSHANLTHLNMNLIIQQTKESQLHQFSNSSNLKNAQNSSQQNSGNQLRLQSQKSFIDILQSQQKLTSKTPLKIKFNAKQQNLPAIGEEGIDIPEFGEINKNIGSNKEANVSSKKASKNGSSGTSGINVAGLGNGSSAVTGSKKKHAQLTFFGKYNFKEIDPLKELEKLYREDPISEVELLQRPPAFKFIPTDMYMKCLILNYVESTLF